MVLRNIRVGRRQGLVTIEKRIPGVRLASASQACKDSLKSLLVCLDFFTVTRNNGKTRNVMTGYLTPDPVIVIAFNKQQRHSEEWSHERVSTQACSNLFQVGGEWLRV